MTLEDRSPICDLPSLPWTGGALRRLGASIRDGTPAPPSGPTYSDVILWHDDLAAAVQEAIRSLDWGSLLVGRPAPVISSRAKTLGTLRDKLQRDHGTPLNNIQDVAGVRFECEMSLEEQQIVAAAIAGAFDHPDTAIHDLRTKPSAGYRAVHVWLRLTRGRVEVQVRTHLQGAWANAYEALADRLGRGIRYGGPPIDDTQESRGAVAALQRISLVQIAKIEQMRQQITDESVSLDCREAMLDPSVPAVVGSALDSLRLRWVELQKAEAEAVRLLGEVETFARNPNP